MSVAALIRALVDDGLGAPGRDRTARARAVIGRFASGVGTVSRTHDAELEQAYQE